MCLIIASEGGSKPSAEVLRDAAKRNSDGGGFAWLSGNAIQWVKGLQVDQVIEMVNNATGPFIVHFRIGTHGPKVPELTHPFPITATSNPSLTGRSQKVLFHNGVYSDWERDLKICLLSSLKKCPPGPWSDSRALAVVLHYLGVDYLKLCSGSRYAVFDGSRTNGNILLYGDWNKASDGCHYSNRLSSAFPVTGYTGHMGNYSSRCADDDGCYPHGGEEWARRNENFRGAPGAATSGAASSAATTPTSSTTQSTRPTGAGATSTLTRETNQHSMLKTADASLVWRDISDRGTDPGSGAAIAAAKT